MTGATLERADRIAENPFLKLSARIIMIGVTLIAMPWIYWMTNNMITTVSLVGNIVTIQQQQQTQIVNITQTQSRLLDVAATEAQSRSSQDAAYGMQIQALKEQANRIDEHLTHTDDRLNAIFQNTIKR